MKKFISRPEDVVEEMLQGLVVLQPGSVRLRGHKAMVRTDAGRVRDQQVAVLSGGGSGHEPAHAGYIGAGMLSAAVVGEVFTSPSCDSVFAAIQAVSGKAGALLVVKNYTGDRLNFGLAVEMARAQGISVEMVVVDDDVALKGTGPATGARGLAGTVFIHRLVGAAAAAGKSVADIAATGKAAVASLATMGVSDDAGCARSIRKGWKKGAGGESSREAVLAAVEAAERGVAATAQMKPRLGRPSYLGDRVLGHPDPGAKAISVWLRAASEALFAKPQV